MCFHKWYGTWKWRVTWFLIVKVLPKSDTLLTMYMWLILNRRELVSALQLMYWRLLRRTRMRQTIQYGQIWLLICLISVFSPSIPTSTIYSSSIKYNYSLALLTGWDGINAMQRVSYWQSLPTLRPEHSNICVLPLVRPSFQGVRESLIIYSEFRGCILWSCPLSDI